jgi:hypothetical protein
MSKRAFSSSSSHNSEYLEAVESVHSDVPISQEIVTATSDQVVSYYRQTSRILAQRFMNPCLERPVVRCFIGLEGAVGDIDFFQVQVLFCENYPDLPAYIPQPHLSIHAFMHPMRNSMLAAGVDLTSDTHQVNDLLSIPTAGFVFPRSRLVKHSMVFNTFQSCLDQLIMAISSPYINAGDKISVKTHLAQIVDACLMPFSSVQANTPAHTTSFLQLGAHLRAGQTKFSFGQLSGCHVEFIDVVGDSSKLIVRFTVICDAPLLANEIYMTKIVVNCPSHQLGLPSEFMCSKIAGGPIEMFPCSSNRLFIKMTKTLRQFDHFELEMRRLHLAALDNDVLDVPSMLADPTLGMQRLQCRQIFDK